MFGLSDSPLSIRQVIGRLFVLLFLGYLMIYMIDICFETVHSAQMDDFFQLQEYPDSLGFVPAQT